MLSFVPSLWAFLLWEVAKVQGVPMVMPSLYAPLLPELGLLLGVCAFWQMQYMQGADPTV